MAFTPTADFEVNLPEELNLWGARVTKRILSNFDRLKINKDADESKGLTGDLYRSVWWTVHNAAGGNQAMIEFYYIYYGGYVQTGTGKGAPRIDLPQMTGMKPVDRPDGHPRKAKPFLRSEIRLHLRWLADRLFQQYRFGGTFYVIKGIADAIGDPTITQRWVEEHRDELTKGLVDYVRSYGS